MSALLLKWFSERPKWLQIVATRLIERTEISDKDISELATLVALLYKGKRGHTMKRKLNFLSLFAVAEKFPNNILKENPNLLMWYNQAITRMEGE